MRPSIQRYLLAFVLLSLLLSSTVQAASAKRREPSCPTLADVTEVGMQGVVSMTGTLHRLDAFMLGADFLPGPHTTFTGALLSSGPAPVWTVVP